MAKKNRLRLTDKAVRIDGYDIGDACIAVRVSKDANFTEVQIDLDGTDVVFDGEVDQFKVNNIYLPKMLDGSFEKAVVTLLKGRGYLISKDPNFNEDDIPKQLGSGEEHD